MLLMVRQGLNVMHLNDLKDLVESQVTDVEDLVVLLELTIEDIIDRFPEKLYENMEKFGAVSNGDT